MIVIGCVKFERRTSISARPLRSRLMCMKPNISIYRMGWFSRMQKASLTHQRWLESTETGICCLHGWDCRLSPPPFQDLYSDSTSIPLLRWGASSWELLCHVLGAPLTEEVFPLAGPAWGVGAAGDWAGLAVLQDNDSCDRVPAVLGAAAGVPGAEALVGCVHRLSLGGHADDRRVRVHLTGKSKGQRRGRCSGAAERTPQMREGLGRMVSHLVLSLGLTVNKAKMCWSQD